ncbi:MAG: hypothetical protein HY746_09345 [Elusimicrobia bacterium]|nr:hypothetical protein [Elusimicrobiota bacterium]
MKNIKNKITSLYSFALKIMFFTFFIFSYLFPLLPHNLSPISFLYADPPIKFTYQGNIRQDGILINGNRTISFSVYDSSYAPAALWTSNPESVSISTGVFRLELEPNINTQDWNKELWLEMEIQGVKLSPREKINSSIYSINTLLHSGKKYTTSATQPSSPSLGDLWMDTATNTLKFYNGSGWTSTAGSGAPHATTHAQGGGDAITNLGSHTVTGDITLTGQITASSFTATSALGAKIARIEYGTNIAVSSAAAANYGGVYISTHAYLNGDLHAIKLFGDISGTSGLPSGDNLGNHVATTTLKMAGFGILNSGNVSASSFTATGTGVSAAQLRLADNVLVSSEALSSLGAGVRVSTNMYIVGFSSAAKYYGDGSGLTNLPAGPGDNLGNHTASQNLSMAGFDIVNVDTITAQTQGIYLGTHVFVTQGNLGIGTTSPGAKLDIAGQVKITGGSPGSGKVLTSDAAGLATWGTAAVADNLGNHVATTTLNMAGFNITSVSTITVSSITTTVASVTFSTNVYIVGFSSAAKYYGDGSALTNLPAGPGDNLGSHIATTTLDMAGFNIVKAATITASGQGVYLGTHVFVTQGNFGIGTTNPSTKLEVKGQVKIVDASQGAGKVLTSDANGLASWQTPGAGSGDNLGNHVATTTLQMGAYGVNTSSHISAAAFQIKGSTMVAVLPGIDSIAYGVYAGTSNITGGDYNVFIGNYAGTSNTNGNNNTANGYFALRSNTTGNGNTANGVSVLYFNTTGNYNTANGYAALYSNTSGIYNTVNGMGALYYNTTGSDNTANGYKAFYFNQTGSANSVVGYQAAYGVSGNSFSSSTIMGYQAGYGLTTGSDNTFFGWQAGYNVTSGTGNIIIGYNQNAPLATTNNFLNIGGVLYGDLSAKTIGISTRAPQAALDIVSTGTAANQMAQIWRDGSGVIVGSMSATGVFKAVKLLGDGSGLTNLPAGPGDNLGNHTATTTLNMANYGIINVSTSTFNGYIDVKSTEGYKIDGVTVLRSSSALNSTFIGQNAGRINTGNSNTFAGYNAGYNNTTGSENAFFGLNTGLYNTTGANNAFFGSYVGRANTTGGMNAFVGSLAGYLNTEGGGNSILGAYAGYENTTGSYNSIVGYYAGLRNQTGNYNCIFGSLAGGSAGSANSFSSSTIMGYKAGYNLTTGSDNLLLGFQSGDSLTTGSRNIIIGYNTDAPLATTNDHMNIGNLVYGNLSIGNVGIGTTDPLAKLEVAGQIKITGGTPGANKVLTSDAAGLATWQTPASGAGDNLGNHIATTTLSMAGFNITNIATMTASGQGIYLGTHVFVTQGNLGIGTTATAYKLDVQGPINLNDFTDFNNGSTGRITWGSGQFIMTSKGIYDMVLATNDSLVRLIIKKDSGNVGIGTTGPDQKLTVAGNISQTGVLISSGTGNNYFAGNIGIGTTDPGAKLQVGDGSADIRTLVKSNNSYQFGAMNSSGNAFYYGVTQDVIPNGVISNYAGTAIITFLNNGNVGIGTTGPGSRFEVVGGSSTFRGSDSNSAIAGFTDAGGNYRVMISTTGNVGIGTTSPQSTLHVPDGKYAQFEDNNAGVPPAADCDADAERGRFSIDTTNNRLYICNGATRGWDYITLTD